MVTTIKNNVSFSNFQNGHETVYFGIGKYISLGNGNQYAIIDGVKYRIHLSGDNCQELVEIRH